MNAAATAAVNVLGAAAGVCFRCNAKVIFAQLDGKPTAIEEVDKYKGDVVLAEPLFADGAPVTAHRAGVSSHYRVHEEICPRTGRPAQAARRRAFSADNFKRRFPGGGAR